MEKQRRTWLKYLIAPAAGAVLALCILAMRGLFSGAVLSVADRYRMLSDAFFITGVLVTGLGCLIFVAQEGAFDILVYSTKFFFGLFRPKKERKKSESYADYKARMAAKEKLRFLYLIVTGVVFLGISGLFVYLFYRVS